MLLVSFPACLSSGAKLTQTMRTSAAEHGRSGPAEDEVLHDLRQHHGAQRLEKLGCGVLAGTIAAGELLLLDDHDRPAPRERLARPFEHLQLEALDVDLDEIDLVEAEVVETAHRNLALGARPHVRRAGVLGVDLERDLALALAERDAMQRHPFGAHVALEALREQLVRLEGVHLREGSRKVIRPEADVPADVERRAAQRAELHRLLDVLPWYMRRPSTFGAVERYFGKC